MTDIAYWDDSYRAAIDDVDAILAQMEGLGPEEGLEKLAEAKNQLRTVNNKKTSFQMELRQIHDQTQRASYEDRKSGYEARIKDLDKQIAALQEELENQQLTGGGPRQMDNDSYLGKIHDVQDKTEDALGNAIGMMTEANDVADETIAELERQQEQINDISQQLNTMNDHIKYADQLIRDFSKRMMTDKCIQVFAVMNILALLCVIGFAVAQKNGAFDTDDSADDGGKNGV